MDDPKLLQPIRIGAKAPDLFVKTIELSEKNTIG